MNTITKTSDLGKTNGLFNTKVWTLLHELVRIKKKVFSFLSSLLFLLITSEGLLENIAFLGLCGENMLVHTKDGICLMVYDLNVIVCNYLLIINYKLFII